MENGPELNTPRETITLADVRVEGSTYEMSLTKLIGKPIADVYVMVTKPFGIDPTLEMLRIVFEDGTSMHCEGEHDCPYLVEYRGETQPNFDDETLNRLYEE